jgi:hypothetical protein
LPLPLALLPPPVVGEAVGDTIGEGAPLPLPLPLLLALLPPPLPLPLLLLSFVGS